MRFFKDFSTSAITSGIVVLITLLNNIIITRQLGTEGRGLYSILSNIIVFVGLIFGEGLRRSNTILIGNSKSILNNLVNNSLLFSFLFSVLLAFLYLNKYLWYSILPNVPNHLFILSLIISIFSIVWLSYQAIFLGLQKIMTYNLVQGIPVISFFIINIIGIYLFNFDLFSIMEGLGIANLITVIFCLSIFVINYNYKPSFKFDFLNKKFFSLFQKSTFSAIGVFLLYRGDIFLVNFFLGAKLTGLYAIAALFLEIMHRIANVIGPILISKTVNDRTDTIFYNTAKIVRVVFFVSLLIIILLLMFGSKIIILFFGYEFKDSFNILLFLLPGLLCFTPASLIYAFFMGKSYPSAIIFVTFFSAGFNILLNILLIPKFGVIVAAIISSVTYFLWALGLVLLFINTTKIKIKDVLLIKKEDMFNIYYLIKNLSK